MKALYKCFQVQSNYHLLENNLEKNMTRPMPSVVKAVYQRYKWYGDEGILVLSLKDPTIWAFFASLILLKQEWG